MSPISLQVSLERRWMLHTAALAFVFIALGLLTAFIVEDVFLNNRVLAVAEAVSGNPSDVTRVPPGFVVYRMPDLPDELRAVMPTQTIGHPFEMLLENETYVHGVVFRPLAGEPFVVIYDVTDQMAVKPLLWMVLSIYGVFAVALVAVARLFARSFSGKIGREIAKLMDEAKVARESGDLRALAAKQGVIEFRQLLQLHAETMQSYEMATARERQTLAYLAHELRTPLQSAQTSLDLLMDVPANAGPLPRLRRALSRLVRASNAALWLASDRDLSGAEAANLGEIASALIDEFRPLADSRSQLLRLRLPAGAAPVITAPAEVIEAIVANLVLNAIQHGAPGTIAIDIDAHTLGVANAVHDGDPTPGFGLGLEIVERLTSRVGGVITILQNDGRRATTIDFSKARSE